jgi:hypothetical protein
MTQSKEQVEAKARRGANPKQTKHNEKQKKPLGFYIPFLLWFPLVEMLS